MTKTKRQRRKPEPKEKDPRAGAFYKALAVRLKMAREAAGMTQAELAEASNFTVASICAMENARQRPPLIELLRIFEAIGFAPGTDSRVLIPRWNAGNGDETTDIDLAITERSRRVEPIEKAAPAKLPQVSTMHPQPKPAKKAAKAPSRLARVSAKTAAARRR